MHKHKDTKGIIEMQIKELSRLVIGAAMRVHSHFGPGFLEEIYKNSLLIELSKMGLKCEKEKYLNICYDNIQVGCYRADIVVEDRLILELKSASCLVEAHEYQLVNYLKATGIDDGLLFNFGAKSLQFKHKFRNYTPTNVNL